MPFNLTIVLHPLLSGFLKLAYSQEGHSVTYTGKLIKVTTGSGLAIAPASYPLPTALWNYFDPANSNIRYSINGKNGIITSAQEINVATSVKIADVSIIGSYTRTTNPITISFMGTIVRADGTYLNFDTSEDVE